MARLRRVCPGAKERDSEVEMFVVFSHNDLCLTRVVYLEEAYAIGFGVGKPFQATTCLEAKANNNCIANLRENDDPSRLMGEDKPRQHVWIAGRTRRNMNRVCIRQIY